MYLHRKRTYILVKRDIRLVIYIPGGEVCLYVHVLVYAHPSALQCFKQTVLLNDKGTVAQPVE